MGTVKDLLPDYQFPRSWYLLRDPNLIDNETISTTTRKCYYYTIEYVVSLATNPSVNASMYVLVLVE